MISSKERRNIKYKLTLTTSIKKILPIFLIILFRCNSINSNQVVGNWVITSVYDKDVNLVPNKKAYMANLNDQFLYNRLVFRSNGDFESPDDKYDDVNIFGSWKLDGDLINVKINEGAGTQYRILNISDSTLSLNEDYYTFKLSRLPFYRPANDTLRIGSYFIDKGLADQPFFKIIDDDTDSLLSYVIDSTTYFIWINNSILDNYGLDHYHFKIWSDKNCNLMKTTRRNLFELEVLKTTDLDSVIIEYSFKFKMDSIIVQERNWTDHVKNKYIDKYSILPESGHLSVPIK